MRLLLLAAALTAPVAAQAPPPPAPPYAPTAEEKQLISTRLAHLNAALQRLHGHDDLLPDIEIYARAAQWILRFPQEFYTRAYVGNTVAALDRGLARAAELERGEPSWPRRRGRLVRAYRSRVDGSVQPYGLAIPDTYDSSRPVRLDVVLHGRGATLNEVSFIAAHDSTAPLPSGQDYIQLDVFGRGNNAYRWSGETDVLEALNSVRERYRIDPGRIVLRGFSMGGAGAWHLGLHYPDRWAAMEAGAGFVETKIYAKLSDLPPYQEDVLHIYDARDYALNAFELPLVGYGGELDPQLRASQTIREQLSREGIEKQAHTLFLVGPQTGHRFHPDSKRLSDEFLDKAVAAGRRAPDHIRFVTWTERYNTCFWLTVDELARPYQRAGIDAARSADGVTATTANIARLTVSAPGRVILDGQPVSGGPTFEKVDGRWKAARPSRELRKVHGLQGPIDDAFMDAFLCVRPSGASPATRILEQFQREFARFFRGDVRVKQDRDVTAGDIEQYNLVLFGDPASNRLLARIAPRLPIRWNKHQITAGERRFSAADHLLAMIYPNPLNPKRYVVLNSGHTFHEKELIGTNALLFPRWGDYAVIRAATGEVVLAGIFDQRWRLP